MTQNEQIEIPLSKSKMTLTFIGSLTFVAIGIWLLVKQPEFKNPILGHPNVVFIVGIVSILFFGLIAILVFRKFFDKKPGLIINQQGIFDNSSGVAAGLIPWTDIQEITISQVMSQKFLMIIVKNPEKYLEKVSNPIKRNAMKMNYKTYGSPISISANALQTDFDELEKLLSKKLSEYSS